MSNPAADDSHAQSATNFAEPNDAALASPRTSILFLCGMMFLCAAVWFVYAGTTSAPFLFDDYSSIKQNPSIVNLFPLVGDEGQAPLSPPRDSPTSARPLVNLSFALNYHFGGYEPWGYHVVNISLHMLSALVLCLLVRDTLRLPRFQGVFERACEPLALAVALVWALHPLHTETVAYTTQRSELMVGLLYFTTLYGSLQYLAGARAGTFWLLIVALAGLAGAACKEVMVTAPVVVLLFDRAFVSSSFRGALVKSWPLYGSLALTWVVILLLNYDQPRAQSAGFHLGLPAYAWWYTQSKVLWMYLKLSVWPWPLVIHYEFPYLGSFVASWPWVLGAAALIILAITWSLRGRAAGFLLASALIILSPTLVVPILTEVAAERRMYLPLASLAVLAVVGVYWWLQNSMTADSESSDASRGSWTTVTMVAGAIVVAMIFGAIDLRRLALYQDLIALWEDTELHQPENQTVQTNLAAALGNRGRFAESVEHWRHALQIKGDDKERKIYRQLGIALIGAGQYDEAVKQLTKSLLVDAEAPETWEMLGLALIKAGRPHDAVPHIQHALELGSDSARLRINLGRALADDNQHAEAIVQFQQALKYEPDQLDAHRRLAVAYASVGRKADAVAETERALALARERRNFEVVTELEQRLREYRALAPGR